MGCCTTFPLSVADSTEYQLEHIQPALSLGIFEDIGRRFTLSGQVEVGNSLPLLRLVTGTSSLFMSLQTLNIRRLLTNPLKSEVQNQYWSHAIHQHSASVWKLFCALSMIKGARDGIVSDFVW